MSDHDDNNPDIQGAPEDMNQQDEQQNAQQNVPENDDNQNDIAIGDDVPPEPPVDADGNVIQPNLDADEENPFLLQPDHPLFAPIQEKIRTSLQSEITKSQESLRELQKLKKVLQERQENAGVDLHGHQKQLSDAELKIEKLTQQHAETIAARTKIEQIQKQELENLNAATQAFEQASADEQQIRLQTQEAAQQIITVGAQNAELKSDAIIRKRQVSRQEEQIKQEEALKQEVEQLIEQQQLNLKQYQDQEAYLMRQIQVQSEEKEQANEILQEAIRQMDDIQKEIDKTNIAWQDVLHKIELKTTALKMELEKQIQELESSQITYNMSLKTGKQQKDKLIGEIAQITNDTRVKQLQKKKLEDEAKYLKEEVIGKLQQLYQTLNADVSDKQIQLNQVNIEINKTTKQMDEISKLNDKASRMLNDLENDILVKNSEAIGDNRNLQGILALKRKVQTQITEARRNIDKTENETQKRLYDKVNCEAAVTSLRNAEEALKQEVAEKDKLITSYEQQIKKNANAIEQRSSAITRLNKKLEEYQKSHPESDNGPLQAMLANLGKELQQASKTVKEVQNNWLNAQTDLVTYSQQYNDEVQEINDKTEQKQLLERKIRDLEFENNANQLKINAINRDIEFMHKDLQQINGRIADINMQIEKFSQFNFDNEVNTQQNIDERMDKINDIKQQINALNQEKADMAASLVEVEEQIMLQQRKIQIQYQLMKSIEENCNLNKGGELAELEKEIHQFEVSIRHMQKKQQVYLNKMKQGVDMRQIHSDNVRALVSIQKPQVTQTGARLEQELNAVKLRYEQTQQKLEVQKNQFQSITKQLQEMEQENEELAAVVQEYKRKLGGVDDAHDDNGGDQEVEEMLA